MHEIQEQYVVIYLILFIKAWCIGMKHIYHDGMSQNRLIQEKKAILVKRKGIIYIIFFYKNIKEKIPF